MSELGLYRLSKPKIDTDSEELHGGYMYSFNEGKIHDLNWYFNAYTHIPFDLHQMLKVVSKDSFPSKSSSTAVQDVAILTANMTR